MTASGLSFRSLIEDFVGTEFLVGEWIHISQERIDAFAAATGDDQWIHTDPVRASRESPYGSTVAHGYLTLSLLPSQTVSFFRELGVDRSINFGLNRVRFIAPVLADTKVRAHFTMKSAEDYGDGLRITLDVTIEADNQERPVCHAETVSLLY